MALLKAPKSKAEQLANDVGTWIVIGLIVAILIALTIKFIMWLFAL